MSASLLLAENALVLDVRHSLPKPDIIPVHKMQLLTPIGMEIRYISDVVHPDFNYMEAHRDDHYVFLLQETGYSEFVIDFKNFVIEGQSIIYIQPGQVHHASKITGVSGWSMAIDPLLMDEKYRHVFEELVLNYQPLTLSPAKVSQLKACLEVLFNVYNDDEASGSSLHYPILHSLAAAFVGMVADLYQSNESQSFQQNARPEIITRQFKKLLGERYKTVKNPSQYASEMCMSLSYLNEVVKLVTGFPVSYWIQQEVILEAKRLLYYSDLTVKEIAFSLGYEDHSYFSRLFSKSTGSSALEFRKQYRE